MNEHQYKQIASYLFITFSFIFSVSAPPFPFEVQQSDGSKITVRIFGDEYYNWMETEDGYVILFVEDEDRVGWYYSKLNENGKFTASGTLVTYSAPADINIPKHLREISPKVRSNVLNIGRSSHNRPSLNRETITEEIKPLIFLVDFNDREHKYTDSHFEQLLFSDDLSQISDFPEGHGGHENFDMSVRGYYEEISNGKLIISGHSGSIVDWHEVEHDYAHYTDGDQGFGGGENGISHSAAALVVEIAMDLQDNIDFSQFDGNTDGVVDVIILVIEGKGVHQTSPSHFWPHMSYIPNTAYGLEEIDANASTNSDGVLLLDGVVVHKYILMYEQYHNNQAGASSGDIHPIGTICHELGHVLGLPDLYDTRSIDDKGEGIGDWGLMGSGNWQKQTSPAYMSAWSRYRLGFIEPVILENITDYALTIQPAEQNENSAAFILPMDSNLPQEYLMIENRQRIGSDQHLAETGMLLWHIDETITDIYPFWNSVNVNEAFYGVKLNQEDPYPVDAVQNIYNIDLYSYDRDADGIIDTYNDSRIEILHIEETGQQVSCIITNPNVNGRILSHDEGDLGTFGTASGPLWAGVLITSPDTSVLSGLMTVFPPASFQYGSIANYDFNIYSGWLGDSPDKIELSDSREIEWNLDDSRDSGWVFISLLRENILLNKNEEYYIEFKYNGIGALYPYDPTSSSDSSFYRSDYDASTCNPFQNGDWNIRAVLSGQNCGVYEDEKIWPGDTDGNSIVDVYDILPIGVYYGYQGCYRQGDSYSWKAQPLPNGWEVEVAAYADANGDGKVDIEDVLVILVNWTEPIILGNSSTDDVHYTDEEMKRYRDNFYEIYQGLSGESEPAVSIRRKLEELFGFGMLPSGYILGKNYPNPFNPRTVIPFYASHSGQVEIVIYDIGGRVVKKLAHSHNEEGWYELVFNAENMSSGIYFYRLAGNGEFFSTNKMLLLK